MSDGTIKTTQTQEQRFIIQRPRLTRLLDESEARIILLHAPAGYGKTTLAREWIARRNKPIGWYSASPASADVAALAIGLAAEIDGALSDDAEATAARLKALARIQQRPDALARILASSRREWPDLLVVLDDYHLLTASPEAEEFIGTLTVNVPARFLIASRERPNWFGPRLPIYGDAIEIGANDLAMTGGEVDEVLHQSTSRVRDPALVFERAGGWPAVVGLAARTDREDVPEVLPQKLYEFLADDLVAAAPIGVQQGLELLAVTGTSELEVAREILGPGAVQVLNEAGRRGLLSFPRVGQVSLHPLLAEFLLARLRHSKRGGVRIPARLRSTLTRNRRWNECLATAEAFPHDGSFLVEVLRRATDELLNTGRVATIDRWVAIARRMGVEDPIVDLADAEAALRHGDHRKALTLGSRAAERLSLPDHRSRAALVAGRAAHFLSRRSVASQWFKRADADGASPTTRLEALWGQFLIEDEEDSGRQQAAAERFEAASDDTVEHALRVSQAKVLLAFANRRVDLAIAEAESTDALIPLANDPIVVLSSLNHKVWALAAAARYEEALAGANAAIDEAESIGIAFAIQHFLFPKASALIGLRRFAAAQHVLGQIATTLRLQPDSWGSSNLAIRHAKRQLSLGDAERAADFLARGPDELQSSVLRGEFDAYRALVAATRGESIDAEMLALRALEWSTRVEGYAPALLARAIVALDAPDSSPQAALALFDLAFSTRHFDSIVIAFRARPDLAKLVATQEEFRNQITSLLIGSADEAVARGAGLRIPRSMRRAIGLSPRELDVYELMVQGLTNREIARNLFISESTTKVHVRHILEKLGARSRVEAVHTWRPESES